MWICPQLLLLHLSMQKDWEPELEWEAQKQCNYQQWYMVLQVAVDLEGLDIEYYWLGNDLGAWAGTSGMTQAAVLDAPEKFQRALFSHALDD